MKTTSSSRPIRRFAAVMTVLAVLMVAALAPAMVVSLLLKLHSEITDVTDIDRNGTVMYAASPSNGNRGDIDIDLILPPDFTGILQEADMIKVTVMDRGTEKRTDLAAYSFVDDKVEDECSFTLNIKSNDRHDTQTDTYSGYIRISDDDTFIATYIANPEQQREHCGFYFIDAD